MSVEDSPEFKKALQEACEGQYRGWLYGGGVVAKSKEGIGGTMEEIQRQRKAIEEKVEGARLHAEQIRREMEQRRKEYEIMSNPHAREITEHLRRIHGQKGGLICPQCGGIDHHNRMNGKPWCFQCNLPLMSREKAENWVKPQKPKNRMDDFGKIDQARVRK